MKTTLSFSSLKAFAQSPSHFIAYKNKERTESPAMRLGTAAHCAVLEPEEFSKRYDLAVGRKGTKLYKEQLEKGRILLTNSEWETTHRIQEAVLTHPMSAELLAQCTTFEEKVEGSVLKTPFRGIVDGMCKDFILDLKTTKDGSPEEFSKQVYYQKYHMQAAIYCELTGVDDYWIVAVESAAPHIVTAYLLDKEAISKGREQLHELINQFNAWDGTPGGYDRDSEFGFLNLELPTWVK